MNLRPRTLVGIAALAGIVPTLLTVLDVSPMARHSPGLHVMLETVAGLTAALTAYFVVGRFRLSCSLSDLILAGSMAVLAVTNLLLAALPIALADEPGRFTTWATFAGRLLGAALFATAALASTRRVELSRRQLTAVWLAHAAALAAVAGAAAALSSSLPLGIDPGLSPEAAWRPQFAGHPALHAAHLLSLVLFLVAAIGFLRRAERERDALCAWLAAAGMLASFSAFNYALFPSLYSEWVYTGDLLRAWFYVVLVAGAAREIADYWQGLAAVTVLEERRRIARELHDGLAQELAFVVVQSRRYAGRTRDESALEQISVAAERALDESRRAIAALTRPLDEPLADVLADVAEEVAIRVGVKLEFDFQPGITVSPFTRETLVRILREAVSDAARTRHATRAKISLTKGHGVRLRISDDGADPSRGGRGSASHGDGLATMTERAQQLGGTLTLSPGPQGGTEVEVVIQ